MWITSLADAMLTPIPKTIVAKTTLHLPSGLESSFKTVAYSLYRRSFHIMLEADYLENSTRLTKLDIQFKIIINQGTKSAACVTSIKTDSWPYINTTELEIVREFNTKDVRRGLKLNQ